MRTEWLAALAALLIPAAAVAQPAADGGEGGGGDQLPPMFRDPRQLSGVARGEQNDPAGRLTVRAVQGAMKRTEFGDIRSDFPAGAKINLVDFDSHGRVGLHVTPLDKGGRAVFDGLATDGSHSYLVLALFPRQGAEDRLISRLVTMPPQVGMRMILAGEGIDSGKPPVDDLAREQGELPTPGPGTVDVYLRGNGKDTRKVQAIELLRAGVEEPVQRAKIEVATIAAAPDGQVKEPENDAALRPGLLEVLVTRRGQGGLPGVPIEIAVSEAPAGAKPARKAESDAAGRVLFDRLPAGKKYVLRAPVQGRTFESAAFDPPSQSGQRIRVEVDWNETRVLRARFAGVEGGGDKVYVARAADQKRPFLSMPFQMSSAAGAATDLIVAPPVLFAFHGGASLEDDGIDFQLQMSLYNASLVPYQSGPDGIHIPLPTGFRAASVEQEFSSQVKVQEGRGLTWRGLLGPGEQRFIAGFRLPSQQGKATFDMRMPYGLWGGQLVFERVSGLRIDPPPGIQQRNASSDDGNPLIVLQGIDINPGERLSVQFSGLPQRARWTVWAPAGVGLVVLALLGWGIWGVAMRSRRGGGRQSALEEEREELLQSVVQLEADLRRSRITDAAYQKRRGELLRQLEGVYADLAAEEKAAAAASSGPGETRAAP